MNNPTHFTKLSNTRGVSLPNLAALCYLLGRNSTGLNVKALANIAIENDVFAFADVPQGARLPTRIHHHMIALRKLELVFEEHTGSHVMYFLAQNGKRLYEEVASAPSEQLVLPLDTAMRTLWREILVASAYVRFHWLKYFMMTESFGFHDLVQHYQPLTLERVPLEERKRHENAAELDSGYRIYSVGWPDKALNALEYKEIYQGLRRWTNQVYLTDDRLIEGNDVPYLYQMDRKDRFVCDVDVVTAWLDPSIDLGFFVEQVDAVLDDLGSDRITIPELIVTLCSAKGYSKFNVAEMLYELYYMPGQRYFFERGSQFLIHRAFDVARPEDNYVQIEVVWRTGIVRSKV